MSSHEKRLTERFQSGEAEALSALFDMYVDRIFAYAHHILRNREDAEEVTSEAFLRAFQRIETYRGEAPFKGWLFGIARNLCLEKLRQPRLLLLEPEEAEGVSDRGQAAARIETALFVRQAIAELSEEYQTVLLLCDVEQWDAAETAFIMDRSLTSTKSLLYRARRALRTVLTEFFEEEET